MLVSALLNEQVFKEALLNSVAIVNLHGTFISTSSINGRCFSIPIRTARHSFSVVVAFLIISRNDKR